VLQDKNVKNEIEKKVEAFFKKKQFEYDIYCTKLGSSYYIGIKHFSLIKLQEIKRLLEIRDNLYKELVNTYDIIDIEIIIDNKPDTSEIWNKKTKENYADCTFD
jgi:predicted Co/Zn/Cd cation transporter (cation efflux family)